MKNLTSIQNGLEELLNENEEVLIIGEDILDPYGGAFRATKNLSTKFPGRVITTPISEAGITGLGTGLAIRGFRPIVEIMFGDFLGLCFDQILNSATKFPLMYHSKVTVPLVIRTPMGAGRGYGPTHSQSIEKHFLGIPGLNVVAPSIFHDAGKLLKIATLEDNGPVLFIENKILYNKETVLEHPILKFETINERGYPLLLIKNYSENIEPDVVIFTYGGTSDIVKEVMEEMSEEEINILTICPSLISDFSLSNLFKKGIAFNKVIVAEEGGYGFNWGSEISSLIYERQFKNLQKPIIRLSSKDAIIPSAKKLENDYMINKETIVENIIKIIS